MLDLKLVLENAKVFGSALYKESIVYGTVKPGEYEYDAHFQSIKIDLGEGRFISARIQAHVVKAGIDPNTQTFTVAQFVALRDANGVIDGKPWSIAKGKEVDFAY